MVKRQQALFGLTDNDDKTFMSQMCDRCDRAEKTKSAVYTRFVDMRQMNMIKERLSTYSDIRFFGGYDDAARCIAAFTDSFDFYGEIEYPICVLKITATNKKVYTHRDYLGAVLSLGIKRDLIGDIVVCDEFVYMFCHEEIVDYIIYNLEKIANARVVIESVSIDDVQIKPQQFKVKAATVTSMRLDCIISSACNMSRASSQDAVKKGLVSVNYNPTLNTSVEVRDKDVISLRGFGKFIVNTQLTLTKKGRYHITISQYI